MTDEEQIEIDKINQMSHIKMATIWRFAPSGHPYFDVTGPYFEIFDKRFWGEFGGFTPAISKAIFCPW